MGISPGEGNGQPTPLFLPGKFHEQRSLAGYSPWGHTRVRHSQMQKLNKQLGSQGECHQRKSQAEALLAWESDSRTCSALYMLAARHKFCPSAKREERNCTLGWEEGPKIVDVFLFSKNFLFYIKI